MCLCHSAVLLGLGHLPQFCQRMLGYSWHQQHLPPFSSFPAEDTLQAVVREDPHCSYWHCHCSVPVPAFSSHSLNVRKEELPMNLLTVVLVFGSELFASQTPLLCPSALILNSDLPRLSAPRPHPAPALVLAAALSAAAQSRSQLPQTPSGGACLGARSSCLFAVV